VEAPAFTTEFKMSITWDVIASEAKRAAISGSGKAFMDLDFLRSMQPLTPDERRAAVVGRFQEARQSLQGTMTGNTVSKYPVLRWTVNVGYQSISDEFVIGLVAWLEGSGLKAAVEFDACSLLYEGEDVGTLIARTTTTTILAGALSASVNAASGVGLDDILIMVLEWEGPRLFFEFVVLFPADRADDMHAFAGRVQADPAAVFVTTNVSWVAELAAGDHVRCPWVATAKPLSLPQLPATDGYLLNRVIAAATLASPSLAAGAEANRALFAERVANAANVSEEAVAVTVVGAAASSGDAEGAKVNVVVSCWHNAQADTFATALRKQGLLAVLNAAGSAASASVPMLPADAFITETVLTGKAQRVQSACQPRSQSSFTPQEVQGLGAGMGGFPLLGDNPLLGNGSGLGDGSGGLSSAPTSIAEATTSLLIELTQSPAASESRGKAAAGILGSALNIMLVGLAGSLQVGMVTGCCCWWFLVGGRRRRRELEKDLLIDSEDDELVDDGVDDESTLRYLEPSSEPGGLDGLLTWLRCCKDNTASTRTTWMELQGQEDLEVVDLDHRDHDLPECDTILRTGRGPRPQHSRTRTRPAVPVWV